MIYAILAGAGAVVAMVAALCAAVECETVSRKNIARPMLCMFAFSAAALSLALVCGRLTV